MDEDFDRLRARDDTREPLAGPRRQHTRDNRLAWIGLIVLVAVVVGACGGGHRARPSPRPRPSAGCRPRRWWSARCLRYKGSASGQPDPNLPPLGNLDGYVRPLLAVLSSRPELAALLASDGLVRRFAVSVDAIARGASPAGQVRAVAPRAPFKVQQRGGELVDRSGQLRTLRRARETRRGHGAGVSSRGCTDASSHASRRRTRSLALAARSTTR